MLHYAQMIRFFPKVSTHFDPCSVFPSYSYTIRLYDIIIVCDSLRPPATPTHATLPTPKSGGTRPPNPQDWRFPQILVCHPIIDDKSTPIKYYMIIRVYLRQYWSEMFCPLPLSLYRTFLHAFYWRSAGNEGEGLKGSILHSQKPRCRRLLFQIIWVYV